MNRNDLAVPMAPAATVAACAVLRLAPGEPPAAGQDVVVQEVPVALVFNGVSHAVMMATPADLDRAHAQALHQALADDAPVLVHCGSANRVGALLALVAAWHWSHPPEAALELGRSAGLAALEPAVRARLGLPLD